MLQLNVIGATREPPHRTKKKTNNNKQSPPPNGITTTGRSIRRSRKKGCDFFSFLAELAQRVMGASLSKTASWLQGSFGSASAEAAPSSAQSHFKAQIDPRRLASQFIYTRRG